MAVSFHLPDKTKSIQLTRYSHGAGCGCKISPKVLDTILKSTIAVPDNKKLIVGNHSRDDAAVYKISKSKALIATTDFFMPIVDDPVDFGKIAAANAISDVYAMGGKPILAIAILGWPVNTLPAHIAQKVIEGARSICNEAGIYLAGGHSIDSLEPIFGLAVNGQVSIKNIKKNNTARKNDCLFLTKPLGVGILTTAEKKGILKQEHKNIAAKQMMQLNKIGERVGKMNGVHAMTDVTGFGLLGHLAEMADGSGLSAEIYFDKIPMITDNMNFYIEQKCTPGGTNRNWESYGDKVATINDFQKSILVDPQTSGGLLIAVGPASAKELQQLFKKNHLEKFIEPIGKLTEKKRKIIYIKN